MTDNEVLFRLNLMLKETGDKAHAEIVALTPRTVSVKIDPITAWDSDALEQLSVALDVVAKTLAFRKPD